MLFVNNLVAFKDATSKESLQNIAIAGATAAIIQGVSELAKAKEVADAANAANTANTAANTVNTAVNTANSVNTAAATANTISTAASTVSSTATTTSTAVSATQRILTNLGTATTKVAINTTAYTIANSAITGNSLTESLKSQDEKLLLAQILGEVGAKEIGRAAHGSIITDSNGNPLRDANGKILTTTPTITQPQQLALHATLGAAISTSLGGDALSGAISGAISELSATESLKNGASPQNAILIGQATGAASALITSEIQGREDEQTAKNIQLGGFVGVNAAANNATYVDKNRKIIDVDLKDEDTGVYIDNQDGGSRKDLKIGKTEFIDEFIYPDGKFKGLPTVGYEISDQSINDYIRNLGNEGGGNVHQINPIKAVIPSQLVSEAMQTYGDLRQLAADSHPGQKFDIKTPDKLGYYNGYELNGYIVSGRSAGNYLAGYNSVLAKPWMLSDQFWLNETLTRAGALHNSGNAGSEIPYSIRQIKNGYENGKR